MTEAEILHQRKMQLKNDIVKPLITLIDKGLDVPHILQDLTREAQKGNLHDLKSGGKVGVNKH